MNIKEGVFEMTKYIVAIVGAVLILGAGGTSVYLATRSSSSIQNQEQNQNANKNVNPPTSAPVQNQERITEQNCISDTCLNVPNLNYPVSGLSQSAKDSLVKAIDNEYKLESYYQAVVNKYGDKRPFIMILGAEDQHIAVLNSLFQKYGLSVLANTWGNQAYSINSFIEACQVSANYERNTVSLFNSLLKEVSNYPDLNQVYTSIKDASLNNHLPAFEKCSS